MPWPSGKAFAAKHNKKLRGARAQKAADVATGALKSGVPEGEAVAIANKWAQRHGRGKSAKQRTGKTKSWTGP